jgi:eukaryotic-like serine/threonine-protein kinase
MFEQAASGGARVRSEAVTTRLDLRPLTRLVDSFVATARDGALSDVRALQRPPHGSLAYGAAGVVSVLLHPTTRARSSDAVATAQRWIAELAASRARSLLGTPESGPTYNRSSLWFGAPGVHCVQVVAALAAPGRASATRAVRRFAAQLATGTATGAAADLALGAAGALVAVTLLRAQRRDDPVLEPLAETLTAQVTASLWADETNWSFAHGWPGMAFAVLQQAHLMGRAAPGDLVHRLRVLAASPARERHPPGSVIRRSWCNGVAGRILLWVKAFELTGDRVFLDRARGDAAAIPEHCDPAMPTLCCGTAGWAYALLALERVERGGGWYERAVQLCLDIVRSDPAFEHASGLLKGYSGILYLAADIAMDTASRGFPFVETLPVTACRS